MNGKKCLYSLMKQINKMKNIDIAFSRNAKHEVEKGK